MLPHYPITITNPTRTLLASMNTLTATTTPMTIQFTTIFQTSWTSTTSPPPICSTPLTISSTIFYTHYHPHLYMNDDIYSSYFPSSRLAGTVLRPGFAGPLLHAPSSYWTQYFDLGTRWTLITASVDAWQSSPPRQTSRAADSPGSRSATRTADYRRLAIILA